MAWCKTDISHSFWVKFFFFQKCLDLYMCFSKTFLCIFLPKLSKKKSKINKKNFILFHLIPFIVYISICFCPRFSRKQSAIDLSRITLQCVRTIAPERGSGGHFHTFTVFLSTPTSTRCHCLLECGKGLLPTKKN